jgi:hypothetical protein
VPQSVGRHRPQGEPAAVGAAGLEGLEQLPCLMRGTRWTEVDARDVTFVGGVGQPAYPRRPPHAHGRDLQVVEGGPAADHQVTSSGIGVHQLTPVGGVQATPHGTGEAPSGTAGPTSSCRPRLRLAAGETTLGVLLLTRGRAARLGWVGVIVFHLLLMLFGWGDLDLVPPCPRRAAAAGGSHPPTTVPPSLGWARVPASGAPRGA